MFGNSFIPSQADSFTASTQQVAGYDSVAASEGPSSPLVDVFVNQPFVIPSTFFSITYLYFTLSFVLLVILLVLEFKMA